ncbi:MAG: M20 family metallopeptidase, partial [Gemmatimonadaceae bacterium]
MLVKDLTRALVRFDTTNPPGDEQACAEFLSGLLESNGFEVKAHEFADRRTSLVARIGGGATKPPICFSGHIDVVPLGAATWNRDPFAGEIDGDQLYGRGSSDMKGGVAAMVVAATSLAPRLIGSPGVVLVITAGEETGCVGATDLARHGLLGLAGAIVVGEPTANSPLVGHKGCFRFRCVSTGTTSHSSMPELGDNAIYKAARVIGELERFQFDGDPHPVMGQPTLVVSQVSGGMNINSVPDRAEICVDVRTVAGQDVEALVQRLTDDIGHLASMEPLLEVPAILSEADNDWVRSVFANVESVTGTVPEIRTAPYFTDGAALREAYGGPPTLILGPGEPGMAHQTDEYCR